MNFFRKIGNFLSCLLHENCEYSIKKILAYTFSLLVIYIVIFTDKEYYELLFFVGGLLGVRAYERVKLWGAPSGGNDPEPDPSDIGLEDDAMLGKTNTRSKTKSKKRLLTD